jgi:hypothetical protein
VHTRAADDVDVTPVERPRWAGGTASGVLALQRSAGNRVTRRVLARQERRRRPTHETLLDRMVAGMTLHPGQRDRLLAAVRSFTVGQLGRMVDAGVRFWGPTGVPPELAGIVEAPEIREDAQAGARASYVPTARFIRVRRGSGPQQVMHELAHAWDNVRTGRLTPLRRLLGARDPAEALAAEAERTEDAMWTGARTRHSTQDENGRRVRLTIAEMLQRYRDRRVLRENRFGTPGTREGYSMRDAREFYAEGYAVFHGGDAEQRTRLREQAPELYHLLAREAAAARR